MWSSSRGSSEVWSTTLTLPLPCATQIPLLHVLDRARGVDGLQIPQSGWFDEPDSDGSGRRGPIRGKVKRTYRHDQTHRRDDDLESASEEDLECERRLTGPWLAVYEVKAMSRDPALQDLVEASDPGTHTALSGVGPRVCLRVGHSESSRGRGRWQGR